MGYLELNPTVFGTGLGDFTKATISFWFRAPAATLSAVAASTPTGLSADLASGPYYTPAFFKTIPLISFGHAPIDTDGDQCSPSFIGIACGGTEPTLACNLQTSGNVTYGHTPDRPDKETRPQCYYMSGIGANPWTHAGLEKLSVTADRWHHALISFDLGSGGSVAYNSNDDLTADIALQYYSLVCGATFSWAFDDVPKNTWSTSPSCAKIYTTDQTGSTRHFTTLCDFNQIMPQGFDYVDAGDTSGSTSQTIAWDGSGIKASGEIVGIPSHALFADNIAKIELAELQFWTGVTVDTSDIDIRRLFIDSTGKYVPMGAANATLGAPAIAFSGSDNWKTGISSGSIGDFAPNGTITAYTVDPAL